MRIRNIALVVGGACVVALGSVGVVACSSDNGTGTPGGGGQDATTVTDTGTKSDAGIGTNDTGTTQDTGTGGDDSSTGGDAGGGVDCGTSGTTGSLHPVEAGTGPYCPFSFVGDGGNITCAFGQHCLENAGSASGPSICADAGPAPDGGADWECQSANNCPVGSVCCAIAQSAGQDPGCPNHFLSKFKGTTCRTACQNLELTVCETPGECAADPSKTCQVTKAKGGTFGLCL